MKPKLPLFLTLVLSAIHNAAAVDPIDNIDDTPLVTTGDLLRGFSSSELARVQKLIPQHPEPPLAEAVPRIATIRGKAFLDANGNGQQEL
ncbi:MAG: hypothetical protein ABGX05_18760, partial [Pirellulaceae bacterium]